MKNKPPAVHNKHSKSRKGHQHFIHDILSNNTHKKNENDIKRENKARRTREKRKNKASDIRSRKKKFRKSKKQKKQREPKQQCMTPSTMTKKKKYITRVRRSRSTFDHYDYNTDPNDEYMS